MLIMLLDLHKGSPHSKTQLEEKSSLQLRFTISLQLILPDADA